MIKKQDLKTGYEILLEGQSRGCTTITILQNWRNILKIEVQKTSGSKASDVWSEAEIYTISAKELCNELNEEIIDPYGSIISIRG